MSAGAVSSKAGPSGSASKDKKVKRTRKRSRNKKRTTEVEDSSSDSSSSSDGSDDEEEVKPKPAPKEAPKVSPKKTDSDSDSDSDSDDEGKHGEDGDAKRKRKRKRSSKKKTTEEPSKPAAAPAPVAVEPAPAKVVTLSPEEVGPDPNTDLRLSDQAKQAIHYAQIYTKDRSQWKFNKAKQNWLLRNALSVPPSDYDAALARKQEGKVGPTEGEEKDDDEEEEGENFVPDDFVPVVTAYLTSVMGGARQRLVESLREAVNAPAVPLPPAQSEEAQEAAKVADTDGSAANGETANGAAATKSVSFGNLALESEHKEEAAEAAGLPSGTDPRSVELRRTRATQMLQRMGEAL